MWRASSWSTRVGPVMVQRWQSDRIGPMWPLSSVLSAASRLMNGAAGEPMICSKEWFSSITTMMWLGWGAGRSGSAASGRLAPASGTPQPASPTAATTATARRDHLPRPPTPLTSTVVGELTLPGGLLGISAVVRRVRRRGERTGWAAPSAPRPGAPPGVVLDGLEHGHVVG